MAAHHPRLRGATGLKPMLLATAASIRAQCLAVLRAWGMPDALAETTADIMTETDLMGVDSHGISMLMTYEDGVRRGQIRLGHLPRVERQHGATALLDGGDGLGHPVSVMGMNLAVDLAATHGVGVVGVVNSHHFGAAGAYARIASRRGFIGMVASSTRGVLMVPTGAAEPILGTNPWAFSAPTARHNDFVLDMATTTVAGNKVRVHHLRDKPLPEGWVVDGEGRGVTDPHIGNDYVFTHAEGGITPLGGTGAMGSHKGYGMAMMVHLLGGALVGASFSPIRNRTQKSDEPNNIGHFFLALKPDMFRAAGLFETDVSDVIDVLHGAKRAEPETPVLVPGEPEDQMRAQRLAEGIPIPSALEAQLRDVCERAGVTFLLRPNA
jgi:LDH2 family malate/lactate/ureidoglycolate dehydrogenase